MRSDFFDRLDTMPALAALSAGEACFRLLPPGAAEIGQIIRQPALEAGLRFEVDPARAIGLDEIIRQAAVAEKGALPLLSFLLDQVWRQRTQRPRLGQHLLQPSAQFQIAAISGDLVGRPRPVCQQRLVCETKLRATRIRVGDPRPAMPGRTPSARPPAEREKLPRRAARLRPPAPPIPDIRQR